MTVAVGAPLPSNTSTGDAAGGIPGAIVMPGAFAAPGIGAGGAATGIPAGGTATGFPGTGPGMGKDCCVCAVIVGGYA